MLEPPRGPPGLPVSIGEMIWQASACGYGCRPRSGRRPWPGQLPWWRQCSSRQSPSLRGGAPGRGERGTREPGQRLGRSGPGPV